MKRGRIRFILSLHLAAIILVVTLSSMAKAQSLTGDGAAQLGHAYATATLVLRETRASREVYTWEVASPRDRMAVYCSDDCVCLATKFVASLRTQGFEAAAVSMRSAERGAGVSFHGSPSGGFVRRANYNHHTITMVRIEGAWFVLDPIATGTTRLEPLALWKTRLVNPVVFSAR